MQKDGKVYRAEAEAPLREFVKLNDAVYYFKPQAAGARQQLSSTKNSRSPNIVVILSWVAAADKHIAKYAARHALLFPTARVLLIKTSFADILMHTHKSQQDLIAPALDIMCSAPNQSILCHTFSNGGAWRLVELAKAYRRLKGSPLSINTMIVDSAPGTARARSTARAMREVLPTPVYLHYPLLSLVWLYIALQRLVTLLTGRPIVTQMVWDSLNDPDLISIGTRRLYCFSKSDRMIDWRDVKNHIAVARRKGWEVQEAEFEGTKHVAHTLLEPQRYWQLVKEFWNEGVS